MQLFHLFVGVVAMLGAIGGAAWCAWVALEPRTAMDGRLLAWFGYGVVAIAVIGAITGAFRQSSGGTPGALHPIAAGLSVIAIPAARYLSMVSPRRAAWVWCAGYVVLALAIVGLFLTG